MTIYDSQRASQGGRPNINVRIVTVRSRPGHALKAGAEFHAAIYKYKAITRC